MRFRIALALLLVVGMVSAVSAATVSLGLILNSPAPACTGCTLSGPNTYALYALSSAADNTGIASYGISVQNVTSMLHRSPRASLVEDANSGDSGPAGFSNLRSGNNATASGTGFFFGATQDTTTPTPFIINGLGQTAGSFAASVPAGATLSGVIQPSWASKLILAEGAFTAGQVPFLDQANTDVFANIFAGGGVQKASLTFLPNQDAGGGGTVPVVTPFTASTTLLNEVVATTIGASNGPILNFSSLLNPTYTPGFGALPGASGLATAPTFNTATGAFSFNTAGSTRGTYTWGVNATNAAGTSASPGLITVNVTQVPEPATLSMFGLAIAGLVGVARRRN